MGPAAVELYVVGEVLEADERDDGHRGDER